MKRELFESKKKIAPGETVTLLKEVRPSKLERKAEILEVLYADGSSWKRP
jgi:hypothetical protein